MTPEEILSAAIARKTAAERAAFLDEACGADAALRARIERLLRSHEEAGSFLDQPLFDATPSGASASSSTGAGGWIGAYRLVEPIGEGGMGTVWLAEQERPLRRSVALKLIRADMASRKYVARFEAERQALALMDHPNIAKVLDAGTAGATPYFAMELVRGVPITQYCDERRLTPRERLELLVPVCRGVQHAHERGVVHRDLKPSNVLVTVYDGKPVPKVIDFGVAKSTGEPLTERTMFTEFGQIVGTPEYMSPEQARLDGSEIDARSDVYALGVLLYELLTGTTPLERGRLRSVGFAEALRVVCEEETPPPSARVGTSSGARTAAESRSTPLKRLPGVLRGDLDWIAAKCLEKDRDRRYESADALAADLARHLAHEPVSAGPPSRWRRLRKLVRRHPTASALCALAPAVLLGGIALASSMRRGRDAAPAAEAPGGASASAKVRAAPLLWLRHDGGEGAQARSVAALPDGSSIVVGNFAGAAVFGESEATKSSFVARAGGDVFVARYDPRGALEWVRHAEGASATGGEVNVAAFADCSSVVVGSFHASGTFGPGEKAATTLVSAGDADAFVARYDADGMLAWARRAGGTGSDEASAVAALADGSCVVAGNFSGSVLFGEGETNATTLVSAGGADAFIARYDPQGRLTWARRAGGRGNDVPRGIAAAPDGGATVVGRFDGSAAFGEGEAAAVTLVAAGKSDVFVARYDADGSLSWARRAGGTEGETGIGVAVLSDGSSVVAGSFTGTAVFGPGEPNSTTLVSAGDSDVFVARFGADGSLAWVRGAGGPQSDQAFAVAALPDSSVVVTGIVHDVATFGAGEANAATLVTGGSRDDVFVARYGPDGTLAWARREGGAGTDMGRGVARLPDGSLVVCGYVTGSPATFDAGGPGERAMAPGLFLARYGAGAAAASAPEVEAARNRAESESRDRFVPTPPTAARTPGDLLWARRDGGIGARAVAAAPLAGGAAVVGDFVGTSTFGKGEAEETTLVSSGSDDVFVARYGGDGRLAWARRVGGVGTNWSSAVCAVAGEAIVVAGGFEGTADFDRGDGRRATLVSDGAMDAFVARYGADGTLAWTRRAGGAGDDTAERVAAGADGSTFVSGSFRGSATFGPGEPNATTLASAGGTDVFLARYATDGGLCWVRQGGGAGADRTCGLAAFPDGSCVVVGYFSATSVFGAGEAGAATLVSEHAFNLFVARHDRDGRLVWVRCASATNTVEAMGVAALDDGSSVVTGVFWGSSTFGRGEAGATTLVSAGGPDVFVARYRADGSLAWARRAGGAGEDRPLVACALRDGSSVVVAGSFDGTAVFGPGESRAATLSSAGGHDVFVACYDGQGRLLWARSAGGAGTDLAWGASGLPDGSVVVCGSFDAPIVFGGGTAAERRLTAPGLFVARYAGK